MPYMPSATFFFRSILAAAGIVVWMACGPEGCDSGTPSSSPPAGASTKPPPLPGELVEVMRFESRGQHVAARALAERYVKQHPKDGRGAFAIGLTYHTQGNHGAAAPHFARALELSPDYYLTHHYYGECLFMLGDLAGSRREHETHERADPLSPDAQYGIGLVDLEQSRLDAAADRFRRAIDLYETMKKSDPRRYQANRPGLARCHARLADVHFSRGEHERARDELLASTTIEPRNISAFYALSLVYRRLGEDALADEALSRYESAKEAIIRAQRGNQ